MKAIHLLALPVLAISALQPLTASAVAPTVESVAAPAQIRCNTTAGGNNVFAVHADKIIFRLTGPLQAVDPADQAALDKIPRNSELDIKVLDNPFAVADLRGKVLSFIAAVDNANARQFVAIMDVDYAMVCPVKPFPLP